MRLVSCSLIPILRRPRLASQCIRKGPHLPGPVPAAVSSGPDEAFYFLEYRRLKADDFSVLWPFFDCLQVSSLHYVHTHLHGIGILWGGTDIRLKPMDGPGERPPGKAPPQKEFPGNTITSLGTIILTPPQYLSTVYLKLLWHLRFRQIPFALVHAG